MYITPRGLRVATSNNLIQEGSRYYFIPNSTVNTAGNLVCDAAGNTTIFLYTTTDDGDVSVKLEANEYYDETVTPYTPSFSELAFSSNTSGTVTNSLALGRNQGVYFRFRYEDGYSGSGFPVTFMMNGLTAADDETRLVDNGDGTFTFTPTNNNVTQYVHLKSTTRFSAVSVQIASGRYNAVSPVTLNRATSFTIPANTIYLRGSGNGAPSNFTARSTEWWGGESGTYVEIYPDASYGSYLDRSRYADYLNYNEQSVDATQLSLADDTKLYFRYASGTYTTTYYYATSTLDDVFSVIEGTSDRVTLHFRTRTTRTYTVTFASGNYQTRSFTDGTSGITLSFDNNTTGVVRNSSTYYKQMGNNNVNGSLTVSSENSTLDECVITTIAMTYRGNGYRNGTVTLSPNTGSYSRSQNTGTWTGSADVLTMTMGKDGNNYNQISSITITYSYLQ